MSEEIANEQPHISAELAAKIALVKGKPFSEMPDDLYIPPDALEVFLDAFQGPLDLLLYLIKKQNFDILDIPIAKITEQYMEYVEIMKDVNFELASEYLVMAAMLAEIKSRMLLPRCEESVDEEDDPRAALVRRLQEYERFKKAAEDMNEIPRMERDNFEAYAKAPDLRVDKPLANVDMKDLIAALNDVLKRAEMFTHHHIEKESLSIRERMTCILDRLRSNSFVQFHELFTPEEGRMGVVVSFIAVLELLKSAMIDIVQTEPFGPLHVKAVQ